MELTVVHETSSVRNIIDGFCSVSGIRDNSGIRLYQSTGGPLDEGKTVRELALDHLAILTLRVAILGGGRTKHTPNQAGANQWGKGHVRELIDSHQPTTVSTERMNSRRSSGASSAYSGLHKPEEDAGRDTQAAAKGASADPRDVVRLVLAHTRLQPG